MHPHLREHPPGEALVVEIVAEVVPERDEHLQCDEPREPPSGPRPLGRAGRCIDLAFLHGLPFS
ncbi:MAG: hypothetical protein ACK55I_34035, partial [bacterium]